MKRTPLTRHKQLQSWGDWNKPRKPIRFRSPKTGARIRLATADGTLQDYVNWRWQWQSCWLCGWKLGTRWPHSGWLPRLEVNHVYGAAMRGATQFELWAMVILDQHCHQEIWPRFRDRQRVLLGAALKIENDNERFDLDAMNAMKSHQAITLAELREFMDHDLPAIRRKYLTASKVNP